MDILTKKFAFKDVTVLVSHNKLRKKYFYWLMINANGNIVCTMETLENFIIWIETISTERRRGYATTMIEFMKKCGKTPHTVGITDEGRAFVSKLGINP